MWVYVVTSFTRYNKVGRAAQKEFERNMLKDGFHHLHPNLHVRYCSTGGNALVHKERVKKMIPDCICDISIILSADSQEQNVYHYLKRKREKNIRYEKPMMIEFF